MLGFGDQRQDRRYHGRAYSVATQGSNSSDGLYTDTIAALFEEDSGVWFIARTQTFPEGSRPTVANFAESIEKKFKLKWPSKLASGYSHSWVFDASGQLLNEKDARRCSSITFKGSGTRIEGAVGVSIPSNFAPDCGVCVSVLIKTKGDMVESYVTTLVDGKTMYDKLKAESEAKDKKDQEQMKQEKEKAVTPNL